MRSGEALNFLAIGTGQAATTAIVSRLTPDPRVFLKVIMQPESLMNTPRRQRLIGFYHLVMN